MVKVDKNLCIGCGMCVQKCATVFKLGEDGRSEVNEEEAKKEENKECIEEAKKSCPVEAIQ